MFKINILNIPILIIILYLSIACGEEKSSNNSYNSNSTQISKDVETENIESQNETINIEKNNQLIISSTPKSDQDILNIIYLKEDELQLCDGQLDQEISINYSSIYSFNNQEYLVEILCFMGAYQGNYEYIYYQNDGEKSTLKPLTFQSFIADRDGNFTSNNSRTLAGIPNYNINQKVLNIYTKERGIGDCGSTAQYQWENNEFGLVLYKAKPQCDGNFIEPEDYPIIYHQNKSLPINTNNNKPQEFSNENIINEILNRQEELALCDNDLIEDIVKEFSNIYTLNSRDKILEIVCFQGAYQSAYQYFLITFNNNNLEFQSLYFTQFIEDENGNNQEYQEKLIAGLSNYEINQEVLSIFSKYAGHGGCGNEAKYQWQEINFELLEYKANFDCDNPISSDQWNIIYPNN